MAKKTDKKAKKFKVPKGARVLEMETKCFHCLIMRIGNDMVERGAISAEQLHQGIMNAAVESLVIVAEINGETTKETIEDFVKILPGAVKDVETGRENSNVVSQVRH